MIMNPHDERPPRFSDAKLEEFYQEFIAHRLQEEKDRLQRQAMYEALFRKEDPDSNVAPGVVHNLTDDKLYLATNTAFVVIGTQT